MDITQEDVNRRFTHHVPATEQVRETHDAVARQRGTTL